MSFDIPTRRGDEGGSANSSCSEKATGLRRRVLESGEREKSSLNQPPIAWTPPSTWRISPVVLGSQSERRTIVAWAAGTGSLISHASGER